MAEELKVPDIVIPEIQRDENGNWATPLNVPIDEPLPEPKKKQEITDLLPASEKEAIQILALKKIENGDINGGITDLHKMEYEEYRKDVIQRIESLPNIDRPHVIKNNEKKYFGDYYPPANVERLKMINFLEAVHFDKSICELILDERCSGLTAEILKSDLAYLMIEAHKARHV